MAQHFEKHTVLIVDDEEKLREILRLYLEAPNREILEAANGQEALEVISKNKVDIVEGATNFHASSVKPSWAKRLKFVARIDEHLFYKGTSQ